MQKLPEEWEKREFNGMAYYIVPIQANPNNLLQPTK